MRKDLTEQHWFIAVLSDMAIQNYAMESMLLSSQKILNSKVAEKAAIPIAMTKLV